MVAPVLEKVTSYNSNSRSWYKKYQVQKPPYNLRLGCRNWYAWASVGTSSSWALNENNSPLKVELVNKCRERFVGKLGDTSQIGSTIAAEWRSTTAMLSSRAVQLFRFTNLVRKGKLNAAAAVLNIPGREARKIHNRARKRGYISDVSHGKIIVKDFGSLWLEYSYGWAPTVSDMYNAVQVLERPLPNLTVRARASNTASSVWKDGWWNSYYTNEEKWDHKVEMIADIRVVNPNLYLSNQLGLTNPAQWLLEGIPFSFVLDWFSNLSQVVSQLTDFVGLHLEQPQTSHLVTYSQYAWFINSDKKIVVAQNKGFTVLVRSPGIEKAKLRIGYEIPNWKRGLNAISLLTQALGRKS